MSTREIKALIFEGGIEMKQDTRWDKLLELSHIFAGR